jgi:hypothetical protein
MPAPSLTSRPVSRSASGSRCRTPCSRSLASLAIITFAPNLNADARVAGGLAAPPRPERSLDVRWFGRAQPGNTAVKVSSGPPLSRAGDDQAGDGRSRFSGIGHKSALLLSAFGDLSLLDSTLRDTALQFQKRPKTGPLGARFQRVYLG